MSRQGGRKGLIAPDVCGHSRFVSEARHLIIAETTASKLRNAIDNLKRQGTEETARVVQLLEVILNEIKTIKRDPAEREKKIR